MRQRHRQRVQSKKTHQGILGRGKGQRQRRVVDLVTSRVQVPRQTTWRSAKDSFGDCCRDLSLLCFVIVLASMQCNVMA